MFAPLLLCSLLTAPSESGGALSAKVVIYGGTSAGIAAAVQARRMNKTVLLIEPSSRLGGLTTGGLGATDIGNKAAVGGIAREFYERIARHYTDRAAWTWEDPADYRSPRGEAVEIGAEDPAAMWTFEPHVASAVYAEMLAEAGVEPLTDAPLDRREGGVTVENGRIVSFRLKSGAAVEGAVFIDATYEGDLMAAAGVGYRVGREAESVYGETYNGVRPGLNDKQHRFLVPVDPYVVPGDSTSGVLPQVRSEPLPPAGSGDGGVQAYCFRLCATDAPANRTPWPKPAEYDERLYELLFRNFEAGDLRKPWNPVMMPNRKTDSNNNCTVSTDWIGQNHAYPEATDEERAAIVAAHENYQKGLMWSLANHPRVPAEVREYFTRWGLAADEFEATGGWPPQLYVREARRMISDRVMTQADCLGDAEADDPVGLAAYTMDSHNVWRYVDESGHVRNEGDVQEGGFPPYPIGYRSIVPKRTEVTNLLVPVAMSASHIAYGSIRMEPVFMVLGQSAATAAATAAENGVPLQDVPYPALRERLVADGQVLEWTGGGKRVAASSLEGQVADDEAATYTGTWTRSRSIGPHVGRGYRVATWDGAGKAPTAAFALTAPTAGRYAVRLSAVPHPNRSADAVVAVSVGPRVFEIDQRDARWSAGEATDLVTIACSAGERMRVTVAAGSTGHTIADAVQLVPAE